MNFTFQKTMLGVCKFTQSTKRTAKIAFWRLLQELQRKLSIIYLDAEMAMGMLKAISFYICSCLLLYFILSLTNIYNWLFYFYIFL